MAVGGSSCNTAEVDTRHARVCLQARAQGNQHTNHWFTRFPGLSSGYFYPTMWKEESRYGRPRSSEGHRCLWKGGLRDAPTLEYRHTRRYFWRFSTQTRKHGYTCAVQALTGTDSLQPPSRCTSARTKFGHCVGGYVYALTSYTMSILAMFLFFVFFTRKGGYKKKVLRIEGARKNVFRIRDYPLRAWRGVL